MLQQQQNYQTREVMQRHSLWVVRRARSLDKVRAARKANTPHYASPALLAEAAILLSSQQKLKYAETYARAVVAGFDANVDDNNAASCAVNAVVSAHIKRGSARDAARYFERLAGKLVENTKTILENNIQGKKTDKPCADAFLLMTGVAAHARSRRNGSARRALELLHLCESVVAESGEHDLPTDAAYATTALALLREGARGLCRRTVLSRASALSGDARRIELMFVPLIAHAGRVKSAKSALAWYKLACGVFNDSSGSDEVPVNVANATIAALANCEKVGSFYYVRALQIFEQVYASTGVDGARMIDAYTTAPLLRACARTAQVASAERVVSVLRSNGYELSREDLTSLISCYGRAGRVTEAEALFQLVVDGGEEGKPATPKASSIARTSRYEIVASYDSVDLDDDVDEGNDDNLTADATLATASPLLALLFGSRDAANSAARRMARPDTALFNAMIDAYARNMQWERALSLFGRMEKAEGMAPTLETYNSLINACARANQAVAAIGLFSRMRQTSLRPSHRTINPLLAVLASNGAIQEALDIYEEMEMMETGTRRMGARLPPPNKRTYLTILAMLDGDEHTSRRDEVTSCASRRGWEGLVRPSTLQQMR